MKLWEKGNLKNIESRNVLTPEIVTPQGKRLQETTQTLSALVCLPEEGPHSACSRAKWEGPETTLPSSPGLEEKPTRFRKSTPPPTRNRRGPCPWKAAPTSLRPPGPPSCSPRPQPKGTERGVAPGGPLGAKAGPAAHGRPWPTAARPSTPGSSRWPGQASGLPSLPGQVARGQAG